MVIFIFLFQTKKGNPQGLILFPIEIDHINPGPSTSAGTPWPDLPENQDSPGVCIASRGFLLDSWLDHSRGKFRRLAESA